jgi:hypothetical protein
MYDHNQLELPDSFVALFIEPGRQKPSATRAVIGARYEFCEDLANHLYDYARAQHHDLGITEFDVLERVLRGLEQPSSGIDAREARWVVRRLAELEGWRWDPDIA